MMSFVFKISLVALVAIAFAPSVRASEAKILHDTVVGPPSTPVTLKAGSVVTVLSLKNGKDVVSVGLPDGSSGIYQIDDTALEKIVPQAPAPALVATPPSTPVAGPTPPVTIPSPPPAPIPTGPPDYNKDTIGSPEFEATAGTQAAGTASLAQTKDGLQVYLLTARHLLGPEGGFEKETSLDQVPDFVKGITLHPFGDGGGGGHYYSTKGLLIKADAGDDADAVWDDLAIFPVQNAPDKVLTIADKPPAVGDPIWIVGVVRGGVPEGEIEHSAKVKEVEANWLDAIFDNDNIITNGASGAPVLNSAGEVIGIYRGHFDAGGGHKGATIISAARILRAIEAAR